MTAECLQQKQWSAEIIINAPLNYSLLIICCQKAYEKLDGRVPAGHKVFVFIIIFKSSKKKHVKDITRTNCYRMVQKE